MASSWERNKRKRSRKERSASINKAAIEHKLGCRRRPNKEPTELLSESHPRTTEVVLGTTVTQFAERPTMQAAGSSASPGLVGQVHRRPLSPGTIEPFVTEAGNFVAFGHGQAVIGKEENLGFRTCIAFRSFLRFKTHEENHRLLPLPFFARKSSTSSRKRKRRLGRAFVPFVFDLECDR